MSTDIRATIRENIATMTEEANKVVEQIRAATTDRTKLVHDYLHPEGDAADETIAQHIAWREAALAKIEEEETKAAAYVTENYLKSLSDEQVDALKSAYAEQAKAVKAAIGYYGVLPGASAEDLKDLPALHTLRGSKSGSGSGGKRPRLNYVAFRSSTAEEWVEASKQTKNAKNEDVTVTNFTVLALALKSAYGAKVEVKDLQAAAFEAAGTDDLSTLDGKVFEFATTVGEKTVFIKVQPQVPTTKDEDTEEETPEETTEEDTEE